MNYKKICILLPEFDDPGRSSSPIDLGSLAQGVGWYVDLRSELQTELQAGGNV